MNVRILIRIIAFGLLLAGPGCSRPEALGKSVAIKDSKQTWQAFVDNGDKPGFGIRLTKLDLIISGSFFLLDPNRPGDFNSGRSLPTEIQANGDREFRINVRLPDGTTDMMVVKLDAPLDRDVISGLVMDTEPGTQSNRLSFVRQR